MKYFEPLNATEYMQYYNQLTLDKFLYDNKMAPFGTTPTNLDKYYNGTAFKPFRQGQIDSAGVGTDWLSYVLRNGSIDNHNVSISGATDKVNYYFSGGIFNQQGTVANSGLKRYTGRMNLTFKLTSFLSFSANVNYSRNENMNSQAGGQSASVGQEGFGAIQAALAYPAYLPVYEQGTGQFSRFLLTGNPVSLLSIHDRTMSSNLFATFSADVTIIPNVLTGKVLYGNNYESAERNYLLPSAVFFDQLNRTRASLSTSRREQQTMEATLSFRKRFGELLKVDAVGGVGEYPYRSFGFGAVGADMMDAIGFDRIQTASAASQTINSNRDENKKRSAFARSTFDVADKYMATLIYRYDGWSQFFPENKFASFYTAAVGWKISNENFLKNSKVVDFLKLRASIGLTGEPGSQAYGTFSPDGNIITFNNGSVSYVPYFLSQLDNPNLRWPKTINKNLGLEFSFFKERISGSLDIFRDDITRLITNAPTAMLSMISTEPINTGHRVRTGWELGINTSNVRNIAFDWSSTINFSRNRLRWEERFANTFLRSWQDPRDMVNTYYIFKTNGILDGVKEIPASQPANARHPGSPIFVDRNSDGVIDTSDVFQINPDPKLAIGFGNTFRYKQLDLMVMFYGQVGGVGTTPAAQWSNAADFVAGGYSVVKEIDEVWSTSNPDGIRPGVAYNEGGLGLPVGTDIGLQSTDFLRCRNITLGYTLKSGLISKYIANLRLYVDAQNPFIMTKFKYVDPEVSVASVKGGPAPYPMARTFSFGIRANF